ncbi:cyclin 2, putative [Babesia ovis]|uniref:Cyclin 2, putative n=1 Tax=Babesia ovis TaxID=5869 RepID=A0A9W5WU20_BABOV|nr:cyclin 2, putative [Babesia ovis]
MPDGCNATEMLPEKALQKTENVCRNIDACSMSIKPTVTECNSIEIQSNIYDRLNSDKCREETDSCANTPRHQLYSARSHSDADAGIETVHDRKGLYDEDVGYEDSVDLRNRPTISLGELNEGIDLEELLYGPIHDAKVETPQLSATTIDSYRFEQPRPFWHLFNAIKSNDIYKQSEDWGIDRSIHTTYARAGFFADCHNADSVHHGDYLTVPDCDEFAECRIPLVVCIISTSREIRVNEVQKGIVPLAVNILDRYMVQHKTSMSRLVSIACAHMDSGSSVNSSKHGSLSSSLNANDISALNVSNVAKELKQKYKHDNLIKLCFKFLSDDAFGSRMSKREYGMKPYNDDSADVDSCYEETSDSEDPIAEYQYGSTLKPSIVYNLIAAACLFIADRYNGLSNTSVKALLVTWEAVSHAFTKTRVAAKYIRENRSTALSIIMSFMFDIYFVLDYKLTTPFPCHMVQDIIVSNADFKCPQRPWEYNLYQKLGAILARIAYLDDSFHRFRPSIVTLAIYSIVRRLAIHNKAVEDKDAWLLVDETDGEIRSCSDLLISTVLQYVNTDILDVLAQPVYMKHKTDELFSYIFDDLCDLNAKTLRNMANTLTSLK